VDSPAFGDGLQDALGTTEALRNKFSNALSYNAFRDLISMEIHGFCGVIHKSGMTLCWPTPHPPPIRNRAGFFEAASNLRGRPDAIGHSLASTAIANRVPPGLCVEGYRSNGNLGQSQNRLKMAHAERALRQKMKNAQTGLVREAAINLHQFHIHRQIYTQ
jgi:hypothetical protein